MFFLKFTAKILEKSIKFLNFLYSYILFKMYFRPKEVALY